MRAAEGEKVSEVATALAGVGKEAVETLRATMWADDATYPTKPRTADAILGRLLHLRGIVTLEARVEAIERALEAQAQRP